MVLTKNEVIFYRLSHSLFIKKRQDLIEANSVQYDVSLSYAMSQKDFYESAKEGKYLQANIKKQIQIVERKIDDFLYKEILFVDQSEKFPDQTLLNFFC